MSENQSKKDFMLKKLSERRSEAKVVRKIVLITSLIIFLVICGSAAGIYAYVNSALKPVNPEDESLKSVEIPIGSSVSGISNILEENGIIKDARVFKYYIKFRNEAGFQAGEYKLSPSMTFKEILASIKSGKIMQEAVLKMTIPEGKQLTQIAGIIAEKTGKDAEDLLAEMNSKAFVEKMQTQFPDLITDEVFNKNIKFSLEGYLFPATYEFFEENPTTEQIVNVMLKKTNEVLVEYQGVMEEKEYTPHKLLTMASLIEEEATEKVEREKISSVFYNRIDVGMPLQTDPTVLYALGGHKDRVLYKDLEVDSPYNTYKVKGLPPGPIANAGASSIEAALQPADTDFLYFLATSTGEVIFTKTLDEHNREKAKHITNN
ncbi:endolytic transglycosylase MltG [Peribacillus alkalitolerans]|uniref:endolytic transglycosylase MltG n=1 Tax=Peribacillus alkalitolerans TaxID=1550385 RepID=UPI0013D25024|nr:endolytic transglycosylase MltG [Peribacillus alkalitolerans]